MSSELTRYVRLNPRFDRDETLSLLKTEILKSKADDSRYPLPVEWLRPTRDDGQFEFYAIPGDFSLNRSTSFQSGRVYGMDVTSGAAVLALLYDKYNRDTHQESTTSDDNKKVPLRVLDLCCAPGLKLCMLADLVPQELSSTVVGVDISQSRTQLCKNIVKKYHVNQMTSGSQEDGIARDNNQESSSSHTTIRLYCTDGTTFGTKQLSGLVFDSNAEKQELSNKKRKRQNKSARAREKRRLLELQRQEIKDTSECDGSGGSGGLKKDGECVQTTTRYVPLFDRVLVDAECSTDGAIRHIQKREASSKAPLWNDSNMDELIDLQKRLIESGYRLLKRGGTLVYSTCSLMERQNEHVVRWLLEKYKDAFIIPLSFNKDNADEQNPPSFIEEGSLAGTIRFNPLKPNAKLEECIPLTGFFLSKIGKR
jgi:SAM-dependent methyltransferase